MEDDVEAINGLKHLLNFYLPEPIIFRRPVLRKICFLGEPGAGNLLSELAMFADANDEVTERDTSTNIFARREIFAAKIVRGEKRNHAEPSVKWRIR